MSGMRRVSLLGLVGGLMLCFNAPARAQDDSAGTDQLREELKQVRQELQQLRQEVETLLEHHLSETILTVANTRQVEKGSQAATVIGAATSPHLTEETRDLLRGRLQAVVLVLCLGLSLALLRHLFHPNTLGLGVRVVSFLLMLGCLGILKSQVTLNLFHLRLIELAVLANIGLLGIVIDIRLM